MAGERTRTVAVRLTPEEHAAWEAAARAAGRGRLGSWVRDEVNARLAESDGRGGGPGVRAGRRRRAEQTSGQLGGPGQAGEVDMAALAVLSMSSVLSSELPRMGSNLNQAVRAVNVHAKSGHGVDEQVLAQLRKALVQVRTVLAAVREHTSGSSAGGAAGGAVKGAAAAPVRLNGPAKGPARGRKVPRRAAETAAGTAREQELQEAPRQASRPPQSPAGPSAHQPGDAPGAQPVNRWTSGGARGGSSSARGGDGGGQE
ncbi:hypothetical protein GCM10027586_07350 [Kineococcus gypseus]